MDVKRKAGHAGFSGGIRSYPSQGDKRILAAGIRKLDQNPDALYLGTLGKALLQAFLLSSVTMDTRYRICFLSMSVFRIIDFLSAQICSIVP